MKIELVSSLLQVLSGIGLYAFFNHLTTGLQRPRHRMHLIFALICLCISLNTILHVIVLHSNSIAELVLALRIQLAFIAIFLALFPWFISEYTNIRPRPWLIAFTVIFLLMLILNLFQPFSLQYDHISEIAPFTLPWGETLNRAIGINSIWFKIAVLATIAMLIFSLAILITAYRRRRSHTLLLMIFSICIYFAASIEGILVRLGRIDFIEMGPLGYLVMIFIMSVILSHEHRQKNRQLQTVLDQVPAAVYVKNIDGRYLLANRLYESLFNLRSQDLQGKFDFEFMPKDQAQRIQLREQKAIASRELLKTEEIIEVNHKPRTFLSQTFPLFDDDNLINAVCNVSTDISDRKQTENELADSELKYRKLFEEVEKIVSLRTAELSGILTTALDTILTVDENGLILSINPAGEKLFQYAAFDLVGRHIGTIIVDFFAIDQSTGSRRDALGMRKDLSNISVELAVSSMSLQNRSIYTVIVRDLTERNKINRMKDEFISTVSHELRTPLTSIRGSLGLIAGGALGTIPDKVMELVKIALSNGDRLTKIINDILDINKLEFGKFQLDLQQHNLSELISRSIVQNKGYADQYNIQLQLDHIVDPNISILVDQDRFQQVMANLISNAIKFSYPNTSVIIDTKLNNHMVSISVIDYGKGIPDQFKPSIFQKFAQADSSDTRRAGGSGLGLSISKVIIEQMNGTISYTSQTGEGTTFIVALPINGS